MLKRAIYFFLLFFLFSSTFCFASSSFSFSLAPVYRHSFSIKLGGSSFSSVYSSGFYRESFFRSLPDDDFSFGDRFFLDGYVLQDSGTGNLDSPLPDSTWNWSYVSAAQYDSERELLCFHKSALAYQEQLSLVERYNSTGTKRISAQDFLGLELATEYRLLSMQNHQLMLSLSWQFFPHFNEMKTYSDFRERWLLYSSNLNAYDYYYFPTYGTAMPEPGYQGSFDGPFADPPPDESPLIANKPSEIERVYLEDESNIIKQEILLQNKVSYKISLQQHELSFGPALRNNPSATIQYSISPRVNIAYTDLEIKRTEMLWENVNNKTTMLKQWNNKKNKQKLQAGAAIRATIEAKFKNGFFAGLALSYAWYPEKIKCTAGKGKILIDSGGFSTALMVGKKF